MIILETKYSLPQMNNRSFQKLVTCDMSKIPEDANNEIDHPITTEELREAVNKGKRHKSPGPDGICQCLTRKNMATLYVYPKQLPQ